MKMEANLARKLTRLTSMGTRILLFLWVAVHEIVNVSLFSGSFSLLFFIYQLLVVPKAVGKGQKVCRKIIGEKGRNLHGLPHKEIVKSGLINSPLARKVKLTSSYKWGVFLNMKSFKFIFSNILNEPTIDKTRNSPHT